MEKGSSSSSSSGVGAQDSMYGLKFGKKIYFGGSQPKTAGGPPSPAKKVRSVAAHGGHPPRCQVEGCHVDLSDVKAYYSRHRVCVMHSKSPKVIVSGIEQRFCQQCSRFHQLPEFDQGKRSCRRRLAGHNERRRKPSSGSLLSSQFGTLSPYVFDNYIGTGGFVMDFSACQTPTTGKDSWPNPMSKLDLGNQAASTCKYQLPWSQSPLTNLVQVSDECLSGASDSVSALSLLSTQPWDSRTRSSTTLEVNNFLGGTNANDGTIVQPSVDPGASLAHFSSSSWGFKGNQGSHSTMNEMHSDLGLGHLSHNSNSQYAGELGLAQPSDAQFHEIDDPSVHRSHWSL